MLGIRETLLETLGPWHKMRRRLGTPVITEGPDVEGTTHFRCVAQSPASGHVTVSIHQTLVEDLVTTKDLVEGYVTTYMVQHYPIFN